MSKLYLRDEDGNMIPLNKLENKPDGNLITFLPNDRIDDWGEGANPDLYGPMVQSFDILYDDKNLVCVEGENIEEYEDVICAYTNDKTDLSRLALDTIEVYHYMFIYHLIEWEDMYPYSTTMEKGVEWVKDTVESMMEWQINEDKNG